MSALKWTLIGMDLTGAVNQDRRDTASHDKLTDVSQTTEYSEPVGSCDHHIYESMICCLKTASDSSKKKKKMLFDFT